MLETFTITLREGIEAALVIGIILAYLGRTNRTELNKYVYAGIAAAIAFSILMAFAIQVLLVEWNEFMEGLMFFIAAFFIGTMLIWMHRTAGNIKQDIESGIRSAVNRRQAFGVLAITFFMIFREGAEIVLFLSATVSEASTAVALEGVSGLGMALLFGYLFIKGSLRIDLSRFFKITGIMLSIIVFQLVVGGIHEWSEVGIINLGPTEMRLIGPLVKDSASIVYTGIMLGFLVLLFTMVPWQKVRVDDLEGIEKRKALGAARREKTRKTITGLTALVLIALFTGAQISALPTGVDPVPEKVGSVNGEIRIPVSTVSDGNLHKFICNMQHPPGETCPMHTADGKTDVRILAIQKNDGSVAVAYDACTLCGATGYVQEGTQLICKRCGAPINRDSVGMEGGCNPVVLPYEIDGDEILIKIEDIGEKAGMFE